MGEPEKDELLNEARASLATHLARTESLMLATLCADGSPLASYAPCIRDAEGAFCVCISDLSEHTGNLRRTPIASALLIEDEQGAREPFARRRLTLQVSAEFVPREDDRWAELANGFRRQFGGIIELFQVLGDFRLVRLVPNAGRFVIGFGQAFDLAGDELSHIDAGRVKRRIGRGTDT